MSQVAVELLSQEFNDLVVSSKFEVLEECEVEEGYWLCVEEIVVQDIDLEKDIQVVHDLKVALSYLVFVDRHTHELIDYF